MTRPDPRFRLPRTGDEPPTQADLRRALRFGAMGAEQPTDARSSEIRGWIDGSQGAQATDSDDRTKPVQHERAEQIALTRAVQGRWYARGYRHTPQEFAIGNAKAEREGKKLNRAGRRPGQPDCWLRIPQDGGLSRLRRYPPTLAVLELKAPGERPRKHVEVEWWLDWTPEHGASTHYGLTGAQAIELQLLAGVGYDTKVAFSAVEALEWFDDVAGPEREVDWPMYGCERGRWID